MSTHGSGAHGFIGKLLHMLGMSDGMEDYVEEDDKTMGKESEEMTIQKEELNYQQHTMPGDGD